jgi:hypothetical protein
MSEGGPKSLRDPAVTLPSLEGSVTDTENRAHFSGRKKISVHGYRVHDVGQ